VQAVAEMGQALSAEEKSALHALSAMLKGYEVLVTYNGRSYDHPLLETRYTMSRSRHPFANMEHLDLLYGARRLFKMRNPKIRSPKWWPMP
jgi:uncharacterized protein YprB with RNaseH-like and TPR domain